MIKTAAEMFLACMMTLNTQGILKENGENWSRVYCIVFSECAKRVSKDFTIPPTQRMSRTCGNEAYNTAKTIKKDREVQTMGIKFNVR